MCIKKSGSAENTNRFVRCCYGTKLISNDRAESQQVISAFIVVTADSETINTAFYTSWTFKGRPEQKEHGNTGNFMSCW